MNIEEERAKRHLLDEMVLEHRALDDLITRATEDSAYIDHLHVRRLKKRKLQLKDNIERIRSALIPDLDA